MAKESNPPLFEKISFRYTSHRVIDTFILSLLLLLLAYRLVFLNNHGTPWFVAFLCELWFTFTWGLIVNIKWTPAATKTYPDRLLQLVQELPAVDLFVTTADLVLEPPIITVNTVLSLLAVDYPSEKLACYVSDDGCSPITFYSLVEACEFAKLWVPFCKKYDVQVRAPFKYFDDEKMPDCNDSVLFPQEWKKMKDKYEQLSRKIEDAAENLSVYDGDSKFAVFSNIERRNHPPIIKVIWEKKNDFPVELSPLIYISREKRPEFHHHYKAGAMNSLTRVSGLMTNAPFMLNVDCDMFVNNPKVILHAMSVLLDEDNGKDIAFAQFPQTFYDLLKDDPFGNQMLVLFKYIGPGIEGLQGPLYAGTNCVHRRRVIYGLTPSDTEANCSSTKAEDEVAGKFGSSREFVKSVCFALDGKTSSPDNKLSNNLHAADHVLTCAYEIGTSWGKKVGWLYGSTTEDVLTGLGIHIRGWKSRFLLPEPPAFFGTTPAGGPAAMTQQKRWAAGLLEILFSNNCPVLYTLYGQLDLRMCLAYLWILTWGLRSVPEVCYALLPAYCIITNSQFLPKVHEPGMWIAVTLFMVYNLHVLRQYFSQGESIRHWWNNQKMARITSTSGWLLGFISAILKLLGLTEIVFEVTRKDPREDNSSEEASRFSFDDSPLFLPGTTILLVQLTALAVGFLGLPVSTEALEYGVGEIFCSAYLVVCFSSFLKGFFGKGKYGVPASTIFKAAGLVLVFVAICLRAST